MRALKALARNLVLKILIAWEWIKGVVRHVTGR